MDEHTPTPWYRDEESVVYGANGYIVAHCYGVLGEAQDNADLIVAAVNERDALRAERDALRSERDTLAQQLREAEEPGDHR